jgi:pyruvate dehydrogenase (quinone)
VERASDFPLKRLSQCGVKGRPGDGINGNLGALERHQEWFEFAQARHEEMAAFMACAHAKFTGEVGVRLATSGPLVSSDRLALAWALVWAALSAKPVLTATLGRSA